MATSGPRPVSAPRGIELSCRGWAQEAALRMLMNNLDPEVAENPDACSTSLRVSPRVVRTSRRRWKRSS